jgi:FixJ family two-component response regulator
LLVVVKSMITDLGNARLVSIVDDDKSVRDAISALVRSLGYLVATFASAETFLNSDRLNDTSCLITDVRMPGMSGVELQCCLAAQCRTIPIIFITSFANEPTCECVMRAGAIGILTKPFSEECLIKCLDAALSGPKR